MQPFKERKLRSHGNEEHFKYLQYSLPFYSESFAFSFARSKYENEYKSTNYVVFYNNKTNLIHFHFQNHFIVS
jgi:hypothetical protein